MKARVLYAGQVIVWCYQRWQYALRYREIIPLEYAKGLIGDLFAWIIWGRVATEKWSNRIPSCGNVPWPPAFPRFHSEPFPHKQEEVVAVRKSRRPGAVKIDLPSGYLDGEAGSAKSGRRKRRRQVQAIDDERQQGLFE